MKLDYLHHCWLVLMISRFFCSIPFSHRLSCARLTYFAFCFILLRARQAYYQKIKQNKQNKKKLKTNTVKGMRNCVLFPSSFFILALAYYTQIGFLVRRCWDWPCRQTVNRESLRGESKTQSCPTSWDSFFPRGRRTFGYY